MTAFCEAVPVAAGLPVAVLSGDDEARLAFAGATRTLQHAPLGEIGVVDVGGGRPSSSSGRWRGGVSWSASFRVGSALPGGRYLRSDPPAVDELDWRARSRVAGVFEGLEPPRPDVAYAVGGSATSLRRVVGAELNRTTLAHGLRVLGAAPAEEIARRYELHPERVHVLPAGMLLLDEAARALRLPAADRLGGPARRRRTRRTRRRGILNRWQRHARVELDGEIDVREAAS